LNLGSDPAFFAIADGAVVDFADGGDFGSTPVLKTKDWFNEIKNAYPNAFLVGCSTSGEISNSQVYEDSITLTALHFEHTSLKFAQIQTNNFENSTKAGEHLIQSLDKKDLVHVLVFSDGLHVNGSELVRGLLSGLPKGVGLTGGLAGDSDRFQETLVCANSFPEKEKIVVLGFYGSRLKVGYGSMSGFVPFGPERLVTKAHGNILYELEGRSALDLYKEYLGKERSSNLAVNQFYFPLSYKGKDEKDSVIRTILSIDEKAGNLTFAGDILEGGYARLMKTNHNRLIDGASQAATNCLTTWNNHSPDFALLISCVGRKIILKQRLEEELEIVRTVFDKHTCLTGFYSYGEIAPHSALEPCRLHNQTMTITTFAEE